VSELLDALDDEQRAVAVTLRGPVVVLAGAGTGKTRTITHRIAHGVACGAYAPERVLAVTFTRKAAGELQGRLRALGAGGVRARTFHGAALSQLGFFWPQVVGGVAPRVLPGKAATLAQAAEAMSIRIDREALRDIAAEIEWRKVSMLSIDSYAQMCGQRPLPGSVTAEQMIELHRGYERLKEERREIDFEDVLVLITGMLEAEPRVSQQVREQYRFFTVDEYQDVSPLQHALLSVWLGDRDEVCVVGDASQTIYSFAGASSSSLLRFAGEHPGAHEFRLERNYRSVEPIVRAANSLMHGRPGALTLRAQRHEQVAAPSFHWFTDESSEANAVAQSIAGRIAGGLLASEVAVLSRTNAQSARIEQALNARGVSCRMHGAKRYFDRADVKSAVMAIRAQTLAPDGRPLFQVVSDVIRELGWTAQPPKGAAERDRWEALGALLTLVDEAPDGISVTDFGTDLLERQRAHHEPTLEAVTISAIHASKGLEWSLVHVIGMSEGVLPIFYAEDEQRMDEERRLAYVALTRARDELRLSGSAAGGRARRTPSRFLVEAGIRAPTPA
jgi:DNA helicase-2/ATP-dependent DNA helicase PcrA